MDYRALFLTLCSFGLQLQGDALTVRGELQLQGGATRCEGQVQLGLPGEDWTHLNAHKGSLRWANRVCSELDCGTVLSVRQERRPQGKTKELRADCEEDSLLRCINPHPYLSSSCLHLHCSDSVRLRGSGLCSGLLEVLWDQSWTSVCEEDFDLQDAEVVCRELGCGAPSLLQGALSGEARALGQTFHCEGAESALMDCPRSSSRDTCSSGTAVELTCSEPWSLRLRGEPSRCAGTVELQRRGSWAALSDSDSFWDPTVPVAVCRELGCGSALFSMEHHVFPQREVVFIEQECVNQTTALRECVDQLQTTGHYVVTDVICSDLLNRPNISLSVSADGVSQAEAQGLRVLLGSDFSVRCSVEAQFPGGSFQLLSPTAAQNQTLPAVNHSAHFLFSDAGPAHKGGYTCVYHLHVFNHDFSSQSETLCLSLGASDLQLIVRVVLLLLLQLICTTTALCCYCQATRGHQQRRRNTGHTEDGTTVSEQELEDFPLPRQPRV